MGSNPTGVRDFCSFSVWAYLFSRAIAQKVVFGIFISALKLTTFIVKSLYWINPEVIAAKGIFADSTRPLEHQILKNVSKSTFGKLLKIVVLKRRVLHLRSMETRLIMNF